jgi:oligopeptide transport system substrate-binding protein
MNLLRYLCTVLCLTWLTALASQTLERGNGPEPDSLDPQRAQGLTAHQILRDLYEGLVREDVSGQIVPAAAQSYSRSADGKQYTFVLRAGLQYSNGAPLTADDFVYSLRRAVDPLTLAPYASSLNVIRGATAISQGKASTTTLGVRAVDPQTLQIDLEQASLDLPYRLSLPIALPVYRRNIEQYGAAFVRPEHFVGNGAYVLQSWAPQANLTLQRNANYWNAGQVQIDNVRFHVTEDASAEAKRFAAGELHMTEYVPPGRLVQLRAQFGSQLHLSPSLGTFFLGFNLQREPFKSNPALRAALNLAIDRERLVHSITGLGELPTYALLPPSLNIDSPAAQSRVAQNNAQRLSTAKALYAKAGYTQESPLQIELRYNTSLSNRRIALAVAAMWEENLGVQTKLRNEEWKVFVQNRRGARVTQIFRGGWNGDYADPLNFLENFQSGQTVNGVGFKNAEFDQALMQAKTAIDETSRIQAAARAQEILLQADAIIPLYVYTSKHLVSNKVCGFKPQPLDHYPTQFLHWCDQVAKDAAL